MTELFDDLSTLDPRQRELIELMFAHDGRTQRAASPPASPREAALAMIWQEVLGVPEVGTNVSFFDLGGDSILSMQVVSRARRQGFTFGTQELFEYPTIAELARIELAANDTQQDQRVSGRLEITPIQRWFFSLQLRNRNHWNLEALIQARAPLRLSDARAALQAVIDHHDVLRLRCSSLEQEPDLVLAEEETVVVGEIELLKGEDPSSVLSPLHASLDLVRGPLIRMTAIRSADGDCRHLAIVVHHLACDWVSMRILLEDLETAYLQASAGLPLRLPPKTTSYLRYAEHLQKQALEDSQRTQLHAWYEEALRAVQAHGRESEAGSLTEASTRWHERSVSAELTQRLLRDSRAVTGAEVHELLLQAAMSGMQMVEGTDSLLIDVEMHGRDAHAATAGDFSRTIGWFAQMVPVLLTPHSDDSLPVALSRTVQAWRSAKRQAVAYMQACYGSAPSPTLAPIRARFGFNYLGQFGSAHSDCAFRLIATPAADVYARDGARPHEIEVVAYCLDGRMHVRWGYASTRCEASVIEKAASVTIATLEAMLRLSQHRTHATSSDFPDAELDADDITTLFGQDK